jgi:mRNA-degrading endonuclease RelE of RelBE toxin-antitoxin system
MTSRADRCLNTIAKKDEKLRRKLIDVIKEIPKNPYNTKLLKGNHKGYRSKRE